MKNTALLLISLLMMLSHDALHAQDEAQDEANHKLVIVWTSDDPYTAERMVLMYGHAAKTAGWFDEVTLIIWGPSAKMVAENINIQEKLKTMLEDGVEIRACIVCANMYEVTEKLKAMDFDVQGMGKPLTEYLKSGAHVLTF